MRLVLITLAFLFVVPPTFASFSMEISPAFQEVGVTPEEDKVVTFIEITNPTEVTLMLELFAVDFIQTDELGNVALVNQIDSDYRLAEYISIPDSTINIDPGETRQVQVDIVNQDSLALGGHYGAVVARTRQQNVGEYQQVLPAVSAMLLVHKTGGERYNLTLTDFEISGGNWRLFPPKEVTVSLVNEGNVHLVPRGVITATDIFNRVVFKEVVNKSSSYVLPQVRRRFTTNLKRIRWSLPVMIYTIELNGTSEAEASFFAQDQVVVVSPWLFVGIGGIGVAGWMIVKRLRKDSGEQGIEDGD